MKKKTYALNQSSNYEDFISNADQQPLSVVHVKRLMASMTDYGFLPSKPIQCYYDAKAKKFVVIDGHHRLDAAKTLGIPFFYVVEPAAHNDCIGVENFLVRKWSSMSFARMYAGKGIQDYQILLEYVEKGVPVDYAAALLSGQAARSGNATNKIRSGSFEVKSTENIDVICGLIDQVKKVAPEISKKVYIEAVSLLLWVEDFDVQVLINKILVNPSMLQKCANRKQALEMLEDVYNYRNQNRKNLAFMAEELTRQRKENFGKSNK